MTNMTFSVPVTTANIDEMENLLTREWLLTNGLGGYSSSTICGVRTRRYHGLLISALPAPFGRMVMFNDLAEQIEFPDGQKIKLDADNKAGEPLIFHGAGFQTEFRLRQGLPIWRYTMGKWVIEKRLVMPHMQNSIHIIYRLLEGDGSVRLTLRPAVNFRSHEAPVDTAVNQTYAVTVQGHRYEVSALHDALPPLRMTLYGEGAVYRLQSEHIDNLVFWMEEQRGFYARSRLWSPGYFSIDLRKDVSSALTASTHSWETMLALTPDEVLRYEQQRRDNLLTLAPPSASAGRGKELVLAADQFIISPIGRPQDAARAKAVGHEIRTVIAGYHWFTDWGRDTMISLEGLTLMTGRYSEAASILRTFGHYVRGGLIPNMFPEGHKEGLYHTADASLWFSHAMNRYTEVTGDTSTLHLLLPKLKSIVRHHLEGTSFGIKVDPEDGLLRQGQEDYQLTWMDAKVDGWVVTPRRGKAVEINALWYNTLKLLEKWVREEERDEVEAARLAEHAEKAYTSFNEKFWFEEGQYLYDVIDGEGQIKDASLRPNQLLAISLEHPILCEDKWRPVVEVVTEKLLTPVGLRTLAPGNPDYKPKYYGDLRSRDAAYHQGTVWAWLLGPFVDAWMKLHPHDKAGARKFLDVLLPQLDDAGIGSISEIFDAEPPFTPSGCIAQAWSVAEALRLWLKTSEEGVGAH